MTGLGRILVLATLSGSVSEAALSEEYDVGPWYLDVEQDHAVAALDDPDRKWTLMVRCVEGHLDLLVRRHAEPPTEQAAIRHYAGTLQTDGGAPTAFPAQTWSQDGFLVLDASSLLARITAGRALTFTFRDATDRTSVSFLAGQTAAALQPVRQRCQAPAS